jgi:hypothetical protein
MISLKFDLNRGRVREIRMFCSNLDKGVVMRERKIIDKTYILLEEAIIITYVIHI